MDSLSEEAQHAIQYLATSVFFLENGDVDTVEESELENYFKHCSQVEIYYDKFKKKGFHLVVNDGECELTTSSRSSSNPKYDLGRIADHLMAKFFRPTVPAKQMTIAIKLYNEILGSSRFVKMVTNYSTSKTVFNVESVVTAAAEKGFDMEGPLFMELYQAVAEGRGGVARMTDVLQEMIQEDECAETVVSLFAVESHYSEFHEKIKDILLGHLKKKYKVKPHERMWLKMVLSLQLIHAVNTYQPFLEFILEIIDALSKNIIYDSGRGFVAPAGSLSYGNLQNVAVKLYRNKQSEQEIKNFIFDRCTLNPDVWVPILMACRNCRDQPEVEALKQADILENIYSSKDLLTPSDQVPRPPPSLVWKG